MAELTVLEKGVPAVSVTPPAVTVCAVPEKDTTTMIQSFCMAFGMDAVLPVDAAATVTHVGV
jgi:hypothetical protein